MRTRERKRGRDNDNLLHAFQISALDERELPFTHNDKGKGNARTERRRNKVKPKNDEEVCAPPHPSSPMFLTYFRFLPPVLVWSINHSERELHQAGNARKQRNNK